MKDYLYRPLIFSHEYTYSIPCSNISALTEAVGLNIAVMLEKAIEYSNDFVRQCCFPTCLSTRVTSREYKAKTVQCILHLRSHLLIDDAKYSDNIIIYVVLTLASRYAILACTKELMREWMSNILIIFSEDQENFPITTSSSIFKDYVIRIGNNHGLIDLVAILKFTTEDTTLHQVLCALIINAAIGMNILLVDQSGIFRKFYFLTITLTLLFSLLSTSLIRKCFGK
jgi:hypothetical protein